jgi:hypothetical protein
VLAGGAAMAYVFNKKAKDEKEAYDAEIEDGDFQSNYEDHEKAAGDYQRNRTIGISLAIVGAVGIALSFVF